MSYMIKYVHKQINKYNFLSKIYYCIQWHTNSPKLLYTNSPKLLLWLCVWFYSLFVYTCVCVFLHIQSPLRECPLIWSGASGLPCSCAPLVCISAVIGLLAVWWHNKPKTKTQKPGGRGWASTSAPGGGDSASRAIAKRKTMLLMPRKSVPKEKQDAFQNICGQQRTVVKQLSDRQRPVL